MYREKERLRKTDRQRKINAGKCKDKKREREMLRNAQSETDRKKERS